MKKAWKTFKRVLPYLRLYWKLAVLSLIFTFLAAGFSLLLPWPLALTFDSVLGDKPLPAILAPFFGSMERFTLLVLLALAGLGLVAGQGIVQVLNQYVLTKVEQRMVLDFRSDLFQHAQRLSLAYHDRRRTGGFAAQINLQAQGAGAIVVAIPPLLEALVTLLGMLAIAFTIDVNLTLLSLSVVPFIYYSTGYYAKRVEPRLVKVREMEGESLSIVHEAVAMLRVIIPFGREPYEYRRFRNQGERAVDARVDLTVRQTVFSTVVNLITGVGAALVLGYGAYRILQGKLSGGDLLVMMTYVAKVYSPLQQISTTFSTLQEQFVNLRGALQLLDAKPEVEDTPGAYKFGQAIGHISFEGVHFSYQGRAGTLKDISFEAQAGQRIGIVGPTGAGKTTLTSLLPRFYDPQQGRILLDGFDIRKLTLRSLRQQIATVMQDPLLFSGTIADNIRYGRLEASMEDIVEAAKAANAHDFIMQLPDRYETKLGEGGKQLSGGERQRISIARAFLKDAPILILDEPTSAVDSKTEAVILESLERLMVGRTTFMIAHRLSTIRNADLILVMNHGELVEQGTHDELLRRGGLYQQLYTAQIGQAQQKGQLQQFESLEQPIQDASVDARQGAYKLEVSWANLDSALLWGRHIDLPKPNTEIDGHEFRIAGWALGRNCPVVAVELVDKDGAVFRRVPMNHHRPDIVEAFPNVPGAENSGFSTTVSMLGMNEPELEVQAVLEDQRRVSIGTIHARGGRWRDGDSGSGTTPVSLMDHQDGDGKAELTIQEAKAQAHQRLAESSDRKYAQEPHEDQRQEKVSFTADGSQPLVESHPYSVENTVSNGGMERSAELASDKFVGPYEGKHTLPLRRKLSQIVRKRLWFILSVAVWLIGAVVAFSLMQPNKYGAAIFVLNAGLALTVGLVLGVGLASLLEYLDDSRRSPEKPKGQPEPVTQRSDEDKAFITATPNPVPQGEDALLGTTRVSWNTGNGSEGQVYLSIGGQPERLFAQGSEGAKEASWIRVGRAYEFRLYAGTEHKRLLAAVEVTRRSSSDLASEAHAAESPSRWSGR